MTLPWYIAHLYPQTVEYKITFAIYHRMSRNACISAVEGNTSYLIAELLPTDENFSNPVNGLTGLTMNPNAERCKDLANLGVTIVPHVPGRLKNLVTNLTEANANTVSLIPPAHKRQD